MIRFSQIIFPLSGKPGDQIMKFAAPYVSQIWALLEDLAFRHTKKLMDIASAHGEIKYIVDVGACVGTMAIPFTTIFLSAKVLAIEPSKYNYGFLQFNCKNLPNVETLKIAVSNKKGMIHIANPNLAQRNRLDYQVNTGLISIYGNSDVFKEEVAVDTLDNVANEKVDWLKIDVEGHEHAVLEGATRILSEDKPIFQVEMRADNQSMGPYTISGLLELIGNANYIAAGQMRGDIIFAPK